jgi:hypothetical protein
MHVCTRTCRHSTSMEMWLHRVPRSEHFSWQLPFRLPACLDQTKELFLIIDAVIRLFEACCSAGWASPGVGWMESCYSTVDHLFSGFFLLPIHPPTHLLLHIPAKFPIRFCRSQSRRTQVYDIQPRCQPLYYRAGLLRHGSVCRTRSLGPGSLHKVDEKGRTRHHRLAQVMARFS